MELSPAFRVKNDRNNIATMSQKWVSTEHQRLLALHHENCKGCAVASSHNRTIGRLSRRKWLRPSHYCGRKWVSTERQRLLALHPGKCKGCTATLTHNWTIGHLTRQICFQRHHHYALNISVNGVSTILGLASWKLKRLCGNINP